MRATNYLPFQRHRKKQWKETVTRRGRGGGSAHNVNPRLKDAASRNSTRVRAVRPRFFSRFPSDSSEYFAPISYPAPGWRNAFLDGPQSRRIEASGLIGGVHDACVRDMELEAIAPNWIIAHARDEIVVSNDDRLVLPAPLSFCRWYFNAIRYLDCVTAFYRGIAILYTKSNRRIYYRNPFFQITVWAKRLILSRSKHDYICLRKTGNRI